MLGAGQEERNRAKASNTARYILDDVADHIQFLEKRVEALSRKLEEMVKGNEEMNAKYRELLGMKRSGRARTNALIGLSSDIALEFATLR